MYSVQCLLRYGMISHKLDHVSKERGYSQNARRLYEHFPKAENASSDNRVPSGWPVLEQASVRLSERTSKLLVSLVWRR